MGDPAKVQSRVAKQQQMYEFVRPLRDALTATEMPDLAAHDEKLWLLAFDLLLAENAIAEAERALGPLSRQFPESTLLKNMTMVFARLPPPFAGPGSAGFKDDLTAEVQVVQHAGASTVLLGFCGNGNKMSLPLNLMHRWFARAGVHVIYLRDLVTKLYMRGITSLGADYPETVASLRSMIGELGATRIVCQGHSGGGFAALRIGLELDAAAILTFGAPTNPFLNPDPKTLRLTERFGVREGLDVRPLYDRAARTPHVRLVYSQDHERDAQQANNMAGVPGVVLEPVPNGEQHGVFMPVLESGRYDELLQELVTGQPAPPAAPAAGR